MLLTVIPGFVPGSVGSPVQVWSARVIVYAIDCAVPLSFLHSMNNVKCCTQHDDVRIVVGQAKNEETSNISPLDFGI